MITRIVTLLACALVASLFNDKDNANGFSAIAAVIGGVILVVVLLVWRFA